MNKAHFVSRLPALLLAAVFVCGCSTLPKPGTPLQRQGDEIVVAGQLFHTGTPVVLWMDPGGYDAYRVERRFSPLNESSWAVSREKVEALRTPNRYNLRADGLDAAQLEQVRGGGWDLALLKAHVDQFVYHYDAAGTARRCFEILHDHRDLSVHFLLDIDGTIYQTLDVKERAWHASSANSRSIGIEIANIGAYSSADAPALKEWYARDERGRTRIVIPPRLGDGGVRTPNFVGHPRGSDPVIGSVQGRRLVQYDFTPEQYASLIKLTATLCKIFPNIRCDYPRDESGRLLGKKLPDDALKRYRGLLGHFHIQTDKIDPGPAFDWDYVVRSARELGAR